MPKRKRIQREHTEDWQIIQQYMLWPEQTAYELLRPLVLFGDPAAKSAQETGAAERTLDRKADAFDEQGMISLFASKPRKQLENARRLPPDMRQLIVDLRVELPTMSLREIAEICAVRFNRRPSHHTVQLIHASDFAATSMIFPFSTLPPYRSTHPRLRPTALDQDPPLPDLEADCRSSRTTACGNPAP